MAQFRSPLGSEGPPRHPSPLRWRGGDAPRDTPPCPRARSTRGRGVAPARTPTPVRRARSPRGPPSSPAPRAPGLRPPRQALTPLSLLLSPRGLPQRSGNYSAAGMPQLSGGGGGDPELCATDEMIPFKDEGDPQKEKIFAEISHPEEEGDLADIKSSLVNESEIIPTANGHEVSAPPGRPGTRARGTRWGPWARRWGRGREASPRALRRPGVRRVEAGTCKQCHREVRARHRKQSAPRCCRWMRCRRALNHRGRSRAQPEREPGRRRGQGGRGVPAAQARGRVGAAWGPGRRAHRPDWHALGPGAAAEPWARGAQPPRELRHLCSNSHHLHKGGAFIWGSSGPGSGLRSRHGERRAVRRRKRFIRSQAAAACAPVTREGK